MRTRNNRIPVYFNDVELRQFNLLVKRSGLSKQAYLRHLIKGVVPQDRPPPDYFAMMGELHSIGNNLNQIACHAHATGLVDETRYSRNVDKLDEVIARITQAVEMPRKQE